MPKSDLDPISTVSDARPLLSVWTAWVAFSCTVLNEVDDGELIPSAVVQIRIYTA